MADKKKPTPAKPKPKLGPTPKQEKVTSKSVEILMKIPGVD